MKEARKFMESLKAPHKVGLIVLALASMCPLPLDAARCDPENPKLTCSKETIVGASVTHYRAKGVQSTSRSVAWLQNTFPKVFGTSRPFYRSVALLVGVVDYAHLHRLPNVQRDLERMRDYLLTQEEFDDVYVLQEQDVTSAAVNNLMFGYFARTEHLDSEDRFLFYYSGHGSNETGVGQMQFSKAESDPRLYNAEANLPVSTWRDWGTAIQAKQALFLFDACALGAQIEKGGRSESDGELLRNISRDRARIAFAATRGGEAAHGDEDSSYFTFEFLQVVQSAKADVNNVGFMTIAGIAEAMQPRLAELAQQHGYKWLYTTPTGLDAKNYPGTFVFLNPKVLKDPEPRFVTLLEKSEPPTPALPTPTPKTPLQTSSSPSDIQLFGPRPDGKKKPAPAEIRAAIRKNYDTISEAVAKKDIQAYKAVYAADFIVRDGANVKNAETYFSQIPLIFSISPTVSYDIQEVVITAPDTAVVTVKTSVNSTLLNNIETDRDTWKHVGDQWLCNETNVLESNLGSSQGLFQNFQNIFSLPAGSTNQSLTH